MPSSNQPRNNCTPASLIAAALVTLCANPTSAAAHKHYVLTQKSGDFGTMVTSFDQNAVRITFQQRPFVIVSKAPQWKVCVFNLRDKKKINVSAKTLRARGLSLWDNPFQSTKVVREKRDIKLANLAAVEYIVPAVEDSDGSASEMLFTSRQKDTRRIDHTSVAFAKNLQAPNQVCNLLTDIFRIDHVPLVPLSKTNFYNNHSQSWSLQTLGVTQQDGPIDAAEPTSCTVVGSAMDVMYGTDAAPIIDLEGHM